MPRKPVMDADSLGIGADALKTLFLIPDGDGVLIARDGLYKKFLENAYDFLSAAADDDFDEAMEYANKLAYDFAGRRPSMLFAEAAFERLAALAALDDRDPERSFTVGRLLEIGAAFRAGSEWFASLDRRGLPPRTAAFLADSFPASPNEQDKLVSDCDPFVKCRSFVYRAGEFIPAKLESIRSPDEFFGFDSIRHLFRDQLVKFSEGRGNVPFMVSSLPGHGKTQLAIANTLTHENLTLILPDPGTLNKGLNGLFKVLQRRPDRKFVVFFDDIVPDEVDWFDFRTQVGGSLTLPDNIQVILASNYPLPPNILSRGRAAEFPIFDETRCCEMIEDFLHSRGMKRPSKKLIGAIGADYCEEFGQKVFTELSPRTLMRYLARYRDSADQRRRMVEAAQEELVARPDAQLFYEFNIELMRKMYGDEFIQRLLKERLKSMEKS